MLFLGFNIYLEYLKTINLKVGLLEIGINKASMKGDYKIHLEWLMDDFLLTLILKNEGYQNISFKPPLSIPAQDLNQVLRASFLLFIIFELISCVNIFTCL